MTTALDASGKAAKASQGAMVVMAPDGTILAMVGGRDYAKSQYNRATQALREPGWWFKLMVYLAALEKGLTPGRSNARFPDHSGRREAQNYAAPMGSL